MLDDLKDKQKMIATERAKGFIKSPKALKNKKLSFNYPTNSTSNIMLPEKEKKYIGLVKSKPSQLSANTKNSKVAISSPLSNQNRGELYLTDRTQEHALTTNRRKKGEREHKQMSKSKAQVISSRKQAEGPKEVSFVQEEESAPDSENMCNFNSIASVPKKEDSQANNSKLLSTNF
jgi:hypothetical protein